ncbi:hypothetical protein HanPSC8_Chr16g0746201 [Helianthus annuus]|nr:hypothetical protein HanPSC8_Chr16g0746201 [Helianthus annuus]
MVKKRSMKMLWKIILNTQPFMLAIWLLRLDNFPFHQGQISLYSTQVSSVFRLDLSKTFCSCLLSYFLLIC